MGLCKLGLEGIISKKASSPYNAPPLIYMLKRSLRGRCPSRVNRALAIQPPGGRLSAMPPIATAVAAMRRTQQRAIIGSGRGSFSIQTAFTGQHGGSHGLHALGSDDIHGARGFQEFKQALRALWSL